MKHWIRAGLACLVMIAVACGGKSNSGTDGGGGDGGGNGDGGPNGDGGTTSDAFIPANCVPGPTQCSNCIDDDRDGRADGFDPECTGANDNDEGSFATGIPGDNIDPIKQDCFFDGNSGSGNDGCDIHVCCLLGAKTVADCPEAFRQGYDPKSCPAPIGETPVPAKCIENCGKLTPPGCDCFGCCTVCDPASPTNQCYDILINTVVTPDCSLADPGKCLSCQKTTTCGTPECGGTSCVLCPGQDPNDLPDSCTGGTMCPPGSNTCIDDGACDSQSYCSNGCCIGVIL